MYQTYIVRVRHDGGVAKIRNYAPSAESARVAVRESEGCPDRSILSVTLAPITPSDLKFRVEQAGKCPYFFDRKTMKAFGDTMSNFGVRSAPVPIRRHSGEVRHCWVLYRRRVPNRTATHEYYFDVETYERVHGDRVEEGNGDA